MQVRQVAIHCQDLAVGGAFYARLLGRDATARFDPPGLLFFTVGETRLLLDRRAPSSLIYLHVDRIEEVLSRLGPEVPIRSDSRVIFHHDDDRLGPAGTDEVHASIDDPFGNPVGLIEFRRP